MWEFLFWLYAVNATLLIVHEIDSAYWKEWELFKLPGGITGFLILHLPLVFILVWGVRLVDRHQNAGVVIALVLSFAGLFAYFIHMYFLRKGEQEFNTLMSKSILYGTLAVSPVNLAVGVYLLAM